MPAPVSLQEMQAFSLVLPSPLPAPRQGRHSKLGDGRPTMVFASVYNDNVGKRHILLGCNKPNWWGLDAIAKITREMRDHRLQAYIPVAKLAFDSLRRHEKTSLGAAYNDNEDLVGDEMLWSARKKAREAMKTDPTFLGGTQERGMALTTREWKHNMPCYLCASMMGYKDIEDWAEEKQKAYFTNFRLNRRGDYSHSCAEAEGRLREFGLNVLNGRALKS